MDDNLSFAAKSIDAIVALNSDIPSDETTTSVVQHWAESQIEYFSGSVNKIKFHENKSKLINHYILDRIFQCIENSYH